MVLLSAGKPNDPEIDLAGIGYKIHTNALIKAHKPAAMGNGKRQEVAIGDLAGAQHPPSGGRPFASDGRDPTGQ